MTQAKINALLNQLHEFLQPLQRCVNNMPSALITTEPTFTVHAPSLPSLPHPTRPFLALLPRIASFIQALNVRIDDQNWENIIHVIVIGMELSLTKDFHQITLQDLHNHFDNVIMSSHALLRTNGTYGLLFFRTIIPELMGDNLVDSNE